MRYFQEANNVTELLSTTAADFLAKHYLADEISVPVRMRIEVKPRDNATDVLGERSFEIELSGLRRGLDSSWECPSLNDMLERLSVASAPRSLQNGPIPQELIIYDVILQFRGIEIILIFAVSLQALPGLHFSIEKSTSMHARSELHLFPRHGSYSGRLVMPS